MHKFKDIKLNDEIYSVVFGLGRVIFVLTKSLRLKGYFVFQVEYKSGQKVHYTEDGKPDWCQDIKTCTSTIYYKHEVNFDEVDTKIAKKQLNKSKVLKLRENDMLEMMSPAGAWIEAYLMPDIMLDNALINEEYHLFRKMKSKE